MNDYITCYSLLHNNLFVLCIIGIIKLCIFKYNNKYILLYIK